MLKITSNITFKSDSLKGRSNYIEWVNKAKLFLEINSFILYIDGIEILSNKSLYINENKKVINPKLVVRYSEKNIEY